MKIPRILRRKNLRATTAARRSLRASAEMGYDDMSEPNMKLSRALLIVLVLHVVAVSGIIAFNAIKTRQAPLLPRLSANPTSNASPTAPATTRPEKQNVPLVETKPAHPPTKSIAKEEHKTDHMKPAEHASTPLDSGNLYVVVKGDNPVTIAKKLKVAYDDLIQLNHIDDPRKLQIGAKLLIPKPVKTKKTSE